MLQSADSNISALVLDNADSFPRTRFNISISLKEFRDLQIICTLPSNKYWFSWTIFGKSFQTEIFSIHGEESGPASLKDTIIVECSEDYFLNSLRSILPIRIYLCTEGNVLAVAIIPLTDVNFAFNGVESWIPLNATQNENSARIFLSLHIYRGDLVRCDEFAYQSKNQALQQRKTIDVDEDDQYGNEDFENDEEQGQKEHETKSMNVSTILENESNTREIANFDELAKTKPPLFADTVESEDKSAIRPRRKNHFRLRVDVRSVSSLKSAAHVSIQYSYPYLGVGAHVRNRPLWVLPLKTETKLDHADATFNCYLSHQELTDIFTQHPLQIMLLTRSNLGVDGLGMATVELTVTSSAQPVSYRCPISKRTFKTRKEYDRYREARRVLQATGRSREPSALPPHTPVSIYATDYVLPVYAVEQSSGGSSGKGDATWRSPVTAQPKRLCNVRVMVVLEDWGPVEARAARKVKRGYSMQGGGLYEYENQKDSEVLDQQPLPQSDSVSLVRRAEEERRTVDPGTASSGATPFAFPPPPPRLHHPESHKSNAHSIEPRDLEGLPLQVVGTNPLEGDIASPPTQSHPLQWDFQSREREGAHPLTLEQQRALDALREDWETWRQRAELQWRQSLRERESKLRALLQADAEAKFSQRSEDLRRAQEEVARLEVRLRSSIDAVERERVKLQLKEEQMNVKFAQRSSDLLLLQRRVREEAAGRADAEQRRAQALEQELASTRDMLERAERRAKEAERDYDLYRQQTRSAPENALREEAAGLRAQVSEARAAVERERRVRGEVELEKEHFRAQVHRLAVALRREREKNSVAARQELEQLRLEFLAREERFMLDGDKEELHRIRLELASLRAAPRPLKDTKHPSSAVSMPQSKDSDGRTGGAEERVRPVVDVEDYRIYWNSARGTAGTTGTGDVREGDGGIEVDETEDINPRSAEDMPTPSLAMGSWRGVDNVGNEVDRLSSVTTGSSSLREGRFLMPRITSVGYSGSPVLELDKRSERCEYGDGDFEVHLARLLKQRSSLLSTGMYEELSDPLLREIDKAIEDIKSNWRNSDVVGKGSN